MTERAGPDRNAFALAIGSTAISCRAREEAAYVAMAEVHRRA